MCVSDFYAMDSAHDFLDSEETFYFLTLFIPQDQALYSGVERLYPIEGNAAHL